VGRPRDKGKGTTILSEPAAHELIAAARSGDEKAMEMLVQEAMDYLFPVILSLLHARHARGTYLSETLQSGGDVPLQALEDDAWQMTHSSCLAMLKALPTFRGRSHLGRPVQFTTWLYAIAHNQVRSVQRGRWRERRRRSSAIAQEHGATQPRRPEPPDTAPGPEEHVIDQVELAQVERGLREAPLTPEQRDALIMFYVLGYKQERIAELTGVQVGTVKKRVFDGIRKLRRYMEELDGMRQDAGGM
jgi:RNA polymerase sigma factor (sigma-70 family)